jgi:hypothetical protein
MALTFYLNIVKGATKGVEFYHKKQEIYLFIFIWNYRNHGTLFFFDTHECQENQIKNPFDPILSFRLVKGFWKWNILSLKKTFLQRTFKGLI